MDSFDKAEKAFDAMTDIKYEKQAARDYAIENKAIELYTEMLDDPELLAEALQESYSQEWMRFAQALGDAIHRETPSYDVQYLHKITDTGSELLMDYATKQAESWFESL